MLSKGFEIVGFADDVVLTVAGQSCEEVAYFSVEARAKIPGGDNRLRFYNLTNSSSFFPFITLTILRQSGINN